MSAPRKYSDEITPRLLRRPLGLLITLLVFCCVGCLPFSWHAVIAWASAPLESTDRILHVPLFWWARIGKGLQMLAGFAAVVDIIGPDWFRARGQRASQRVADARDRVALSKLRRRLEGRAWGIASYLIEDLEIETGARRPVVLNPEDLDWGIEDLVNEQDYNRILQELRESIRVACRCDQVHGDLCEAQLDVVRAKVRAFLAVNATERERRALALPEPNDVFFLLRLFWPGPGFAVVVLALVMVEFVSDYAAVGVLLFALAGEMVMTTERGRWTLVLLLERGVRRLKVGSRWWHGQRLVSAAGRVRTWAEDYGIQTWRGPADWVEWQVIRGLPSLLVARPLAALLDRTRPDHILLWVALVVFAVGSILDVLSS